MTMASSSRTSPRSSPPLEDRVSREEEATIEVVGGGMKDSKEAGIEKSEAGSSRATPKTEEKTAIPPTTASEPTSPQRPPRSAVEAAGDSAMARFASLIRSGKAKNIVVLTGAGISTSAGIPDFRSPATGLYANLQRLKLPFPEAVFDIKFFKENPKPFWTLAKELYPGQHLPTPTHYFFLLLERHGILRRVFSQNIDTLETIAGLPPSRIVEAHGSFATAHCLTCRKAASKEYVLKSGVRKGEVVRCGEDGCEGLVKPDIVFFGEDLPERFFKHLDDLTICDLLIVIGTSLQVHPFANLPNYVQPHVPRLLINREPVGPFSHLPSSRSTYHRSLASMFADLATHDKGKKDDGGRDRFWEGDADDGVRRMAQELGWGDELEDMIREGTERLEREWAEELGTGGASEKSGDASEAERIETVQKVVKQVGEVVGSADSE